MPDPAISESGEPRIARGTLRRRLILVSLAVTLGCLAAVGLVLDNAFRNTAEQTVRERLMLHVYAVLGVSELADGVLEMPAQMQEPQFNTLGTGLYALVLDVEAGELWRSESALALVFAPGDLDRIAAGLPTGNTSFGHLSLSGEDQFFLAYRVLWQVAPDQERALTYLIIEHRDPYLAQLATFRRSLFGGLLLALLFLVVVQTVVFNWTVSPLARVAGEVRRIELGEQSSIDGAYPAEIAGLADNLNRLLVAERARRERYQQTLADLAHSLKTPLAILNGIAADSPAGGDSQQVATIHDQVTRMRAIVDYQLERAASTGVALGQERIALAPHIEDLATTLNKVYAEKAPRMALALEPVAMRMDARDFLEMSGNLMENACKYCDSMVAVRLTKTGSEINLSVEDDGPGIAPEARAHVLQRGGRLDESIPGQGIGLAVVREIVERYDGALAISRSDLGGTQVTVTFPPS